MGGTAGDDSCPFGRDRGFFIAENNGCGRSITKNLRRKTMLKQNVDFAVYTKTTPNEEGYFGTYGGAYIPPQLVAEFDKISAGYQTICKSSKFISNRHTNKFSQNNMLAAEKQ